MRPNDFRRHDLHILITGAAGMIGRKLTARLLADGALHGRAIERLTLHDVVPVPADAIGGKSSAAIDTAASDLAAPGEAGRLIAKRPDTIFHLAGVVSGEAELDFAKGYHVHLDGMQALLAAIRAAGEGYHPKLVFSSSMAVYGAPFPPAIPDEFHLTPLTSYGTQKAICELLLADHHRRGFLDGVGIRLPTICVRPGKPNKAASGFFSGIIREPLAGQEAALPVADTVRHTHASPRAAVGFLIQAAGLTREQLGPRINLAMPGVCCTVAEQIEALRHVAGDQVAGRIRREPDEMIMRIVGGWAERIEARRASALGFKAESSFDEIIRAHIDDELGGKVAA
jgi:nucleoside-diphosphate-sugar epimerase